MLQSDSEESELKDEAKAVAARMGGRCQKAFVSLFGLDSEPAGRPGAVPTQ
jgi:hypothetical protein